MVWPPQLETADWVGGDTGKEFEFDMVDAGCAVRSIRTWAVYNALAGLEITFTDGTVKKCGMTNNDDAKYQGMIRFDWEGGETVKSLSMWGNGAGTRCGSFKITTNKNQTYQPKMTSWGLKTEYPMNDNLGCGMLMGCYGKIGDDPQDIRHLGFLFLRKVTTTMLKNVKYDMKGENLQPPIQKEALSILIPNVTSIPFTAQHVVSKSQSTGGSWSITAGFQFGEEYSVSASIPEVVSVSAKTSWQISASSTYGSTWSNQEQSSTTIPCAVPRYSKVNFTVNYFQGELSNLPFEAEMIYYLANKTEWKTSVQGAYKCVSNTKFIEKAVVVAKYDEGTNKWTDTPPAARHPITSKL